jgi:hypothetical protein
LLFGFYYFGHFSKITLVCNVDQFYRAQEKKLFIVKKFLIRQSMKWATFWVIFGGQWAIFFAKKHPVALEASGIAKKQRFSTLFDEGNGLSML